MGYAGTTGTSGSSPSYAGNPSSAAPSGAESIGSVTIRNSDIGKIVGDGGAPGSELQKNIADAVHNSMDPSHSLTSELVAASLNEMSRASRPQIQPSFQPELTAALNSQNFSTSVSNSSGWAK